MAFRLSQLINGSNVFSDLITNEGFDSSLSKVHDSNFLSDDKLTN